MSLTVWWHNYIIFWRVKQLCLLSLSSAQMLKSEAFAVLLAAQPRPGCRNSAVLTPPGRGSWCHTLCCAWNRSSWKITWGGKGVAGRSTSLGTNGKGEWWLCTPAWVVLSPNASRRLLRDPAFMSRTHFLPTMRCKSGCGSSSAPKHQGSQHEAAKDAPVPSWIYNSPSLLWALNFHSESVKALP